MIASYVVRSNERQGYGLGLWRLTLFQQYVSCVMVVSFIGRGRRRAHRKLPICRKSLTNYHIMLYRVHLAGAGFELTTSVVIDTHCIGSCKSNYHTITTTTTPLKFYMTYSYVYIFLYIHFPGTI